MVIHDGVVDLDKLRIAVPLAPSGEAIPSVEASATVLPL